MKHESEATLMVKWIDGYIIPREQALTDGSANSYEEYREACGMIAGMRIVRNELVRRNKKYETED
jgi:hypothetical protein